LAFIFQFIGVLYRWKNVNTVIPGLGIQSLLLFGDREEHTGYQDAYENQDAQQAIESADDPSHDHGADTGHRCPIDEFPFEYLEHEWALKAFI
jgi:hypothetical protein